MTKQILERYDDLLTKSINNDSHAQMTDKEFDELHSLSEQIQNALNVVKRIQDRINIIEEGIEKPFPDNVIPLRDTEELQVLRSMLKLH